MIFIAKINKCTCGFFILKKFMSIWLYLFSCTIGGGIAKIVAVKQGIPVMAISSPGISLIHRGYGVKICAYSTSMNFMSFKNIQKGIEMCMCMYLNTSGEQRWLEFFSSKYFLNHDVSTALLKTGIKVLE